MPPFDFLKKNNTTRSYPTDILIGELFVKAGVISQKQLDDTARSAGTKHLHIGQMLTMSGFINHRDLQSAVDAQSMLRDKVIDMTLAARCLKISCKSGASFQDLVKEELAIEQQASSQTNRLGELLIDSGIINKAVFGAAMQRSLATGLPLGRILVLNGSMPDSLLRVALELQVRVRDDMMHRREALEALKNEGSKAGATLTGDQGLYADLKLKPTRQKTVRIGELLVMANFLNETDVMSCLELGLLTERPIGEIMVEQGYVSNDMLQVALVVQQMIEEGLFDREQAGQAMRSMHETGNILPDVQSRLNSSYTPPGMDVPSVDRELESEFSEASKRATATGGDEAPSLESLMASVVGTEGDSKKSGSTASRLAALENHYLKEDEQQPAKDDDKEYGGGAPSADHSFEALLIASNVVTAGDIDRALTMARENPLALADVLKATGFFTDIGRQAALDCNSLLEKGDFALANAAQVLDHCINKGRLRDLTFESALVELGWTRENLPDAATAATAPKLHDAVPFSLESKLHAVEDSRAADIEADVPVAKVEEVRATESGAKAASAEGSDLLSLFGLSDQAKNTEAEEKSAQVAAQAEALIASLAQMPDEAIASADAEASQARPDAFQTTAVFSTIANEEVDKITDKVAQESSSSLDSLLRKLENAVNDAPLDAVNALGTTGDAPEEPLSDPLYDPLLDSLSAPLDRSFENVPGLDSLLSAAEFNIDLKEPVEPALPAPAELAFSLEDPKPAADAAFGEEVQPSPVAEVESADQLIAQLIAGESNGNSASAEESKPEDEVDLRSLFSNIKLERTGEYDRAKFPAESEPATVSPAPAAPAPIPAPAPAPVAEASAPVAPAPTPAPTPTPAAPRPAAVTAEVSFAASQIPAVLKPGASNSRLNKMNEAEVAAAKAAQISSMSSALTKMAETHYEQENYPEAQRAYERILSWRQGELGSSHPEVVDDLNNLAGVMCVQGLFSEAEPLIVRAINILEHAEVQEPLKLAENLTSLAGLQFQQGTFDKAEPLLAEALVLREKELGANNPELADSLRDFAKLLKKLGKPEEAEKHYTRAKVLLGRV